MAIWKDNTVPQPNPVQPPPPIEPARVDVQPKQYTPVAAPAPVARADASGPRKESVIAPDITIEGGAKLTGSVRADKVTVAGELEGNIEESSHVDLQQTGVISGDLKAGSLTVVAGARMRGRAEFGWDDSAPKAVKGNGHGVGSNGGE